MTKIRVFPFIPELLRGEGENGGNITDIEAFKDWVRKNGKSFRHSAGAGQREDIFVYAWKEKASEWNPVGDAIVLLSRKSVDKRSIEITTDAIRIYPNKVRALEVKAKGRTSAIRLSNTKYGDLIAQAYR